MRNLMSWVLLGYGVALGFAPPAAARDCQRLGERISFLALGDTGMLASTLGPAPGQMAVGRALARLDRRDSADALLFLSDNFYPDGLLDDTLVTRLRANLIKPYCRFLSTRGPR